MEILFEDNHLIAVNKSVADIVQVDKTGDVSLEVKVKEYIKKKYNKPGEVFLGVTHRIDRPVSGVVLFARTSKALARINQMFQDKEIKKTYWAIVKDKPPEDFGSLTHYITRNTEKNKSFASEKEIKNSKLALLTYKIIDRSDRYYLLEVDLQTGRHHQIRCQLARVGCPVRGDLKYGYPRSNEDGGISLHSRTIEFTHPVSRQKVKIVADPPDDKLWNFFKTRQK
jgi:23S rRNA pseudouridine1911/1915/1917 synthase